MTWVAWRVQRTQIAAVVALVLLTAVYLLVSGEHTAAVNFALGHSRCSQSPRPTQYCTNLLGELGADRTMKTLAFGLLYVVPCASGLVLGSPLIAREDSSGTSKVAFGQSVTRLRWLATQLAVPTATLAVVLAVLVPVAAHWNSQTQDVALVLPNEFDASGLVLVGYGLGSFAVGLAIGAVLRRETWAFAAAVPVVFAARLLARKVIRSHLAPMAAAVGRIHFAGLSYQLSGSVSAWIVNVGYARVGSTTLAENQQYASDQVDRCFNRHTGVGRPSCPALQHFRQVILYHPGSQYWTLQWREALVFLVLAAALSGLVALGLRRLWITP